MTGEIKAQEMCHEIEAAPGKGKCDPTACQQMCSQRRGLLRPIF